MAHRPIRSPEAHNPVEIEQETSMENTPSSGGPNKLLLGCGGAFVVMVLTVVIGGYIAFNHTSLPVRAMVGLLNQSPDIQIEGVSGSFSSGFTVQSIRLTDENGNVNELTDARLRYDRDGETLIITELHLGSAHLFVDFSAFESSESSSTEPSAGEEASVPTDGESIPMVIQKASINDVKLQDVQTGELFHLKSVQLDNLILGQGRLKLDRLVIDSSTCRLMVLPADGRDDAYHIEGRLEKGFHKRILAPIEIAGDLVVGDESALEMNLQTLGGSIELVKNDSRPDVLKTRNLNPARFIDGFPPFGKLDVDYVKTEKDVSISGTFEFAGQPFAIDQKLTLAEAESNPPAVAVHESGGVKYELRFSEPEEEDARSFKLALVTKPAMPLKKALAKLLFDLPPEKLSQQQQQELEAVGEHLSR
ncbi:MAG: hypothetical protein R3236_02685 [Phycisphaeraceae bacterium]|nr:hypothetical protein [Phycisphaeraceae bacterium]